MNVHALTNGRYSNILSALSAGNSATAVAEAITELAVGHRMRACCQYCNPSSSALYLAQHRLTIGDRLLQDLRDRQDLGDPGPRPVR